MCVFSSITKIQLTVKHYDGIITRFHSFRQHSATKTKRVYDMRAYSFRYTSHSNGIEINTTKQYENKNNNRR